MACLEILTGDQAGQIVALTDDMMGLGRHTDNDLCLSDGLASRYHACITRQGSGFILEDLGSLNGTELCGSQIRPHISCALTAGDVITIGTTRLCFHATERAVEGRHEALNPAGQSSQAQPSESVQPLEQSARTQVLHLVEEEAASPVIIATRDATIDPCKVIARQHHTPEEVQRVCRQLQAMCQMHVALGTTTDLPAMMAILLDGLLELYPRAERAFMLLSASDSTDLLPLAGKTRHEPQLQQDGPVLSRTIVQTVKEQKCAILSHDALADPRFKLQDSVIARGIRSLMCAPILIEGQFFGVIQLDTRIGVQSFTGDDLELLTAVSAQAALAIKQAQLIEQLRTANTALQHEIAQRQHAEAEREHLQQQLLDSSRQAGKAEMATGVLHNVGNVLNSVNVSAHLLSEQLYQSEVTRLFQANAVIQDHATQLGTFFSDDERGQHFPRFFSALAHKLEAEHEAFVGELASLRHNVEHIKEIIRLQQLSARMSGIQEDIDLLSLVEHALKTLDVSLFHTHLEVVCEGDQVLRLFTDKHKVLQIPVNLIANAKHALIHANRDHPCLTLRIFHPTTARAAVEVIDNGVGIARDHLTRIFQHGFTTKPDGHGFGLHSSALAAQELGGALTVHSEGPGCGATFRLELPLHPTEVKT